MTLQPIDNFANLRGLVRPEHRETLEQMGELAYRFRELEHGINRVIAEGKRPTPRRYVQKHMAISHATVRGNNQWWYHGELATPAVDGPIDTFNLTLHHIIAINELERFNTALQIDGSPRTINGATITIGAVGSTMTGEQPFTTMCWGPYWYNEDGAAIYMISRANPIIAVDCAP